MTTLELITSSLRAIGQLIPGRGPSAIEANEALFVLNSMLDSWSTEHLTVYHTPRDIYTLQASKRDYTIGQPGGDFNRERPVRIERAGLMIDTSEKEVTVYRDQTKWANVAQKSTPGAPSELYHEAAYPLAILHLAPVPDAAYTLVLYPWRQLGSIASVNDDIAFPPGYPEAIRYNLALRLAMEWQRTPQRPGILPWLVEQAQESKARIRSLNITYPEMTCDPALLAIGETSVSWDWRTGE